MVKAQDLKHIFHNALDIIYGKNEVDSLFFLCVAYYCNCDRIALSLKPDMSFCERQTQHILNALDHLKQEKPIQYICIYFD